MGHEVLNDSRLTLAKVFFAQQGSQTARDLGMGSERDMRKLALSAASGIIDDVLLDKLVVLGVESDTLAALTLVPLVAVAWADGSIDEKERAALLSAASGTGLDPAGPAFQLLTQWLTQHPGPQLVDTWADYIRGTSDTLGKDARQALELHLLGRARHVAEAAGGLLGHRSKVSHAEEAMLTKLKTAFAC